MNSVGQLYGDLTAKAEQDAELNRDNFKQDVELTPDEQERIDAMKAKHDKSLMVSESTATSSVQIPVEEYIKTMDDDVAMIGETALKLINTGDISKTAADIKRDTEQKAMAMYRDISICDNAEMSDDDIIAATTKAVDALKEHFKRETLDAADISHRLSKMPLNRIIELLPKEFVDFYVTPGEIMANNVKAKDRLLSVISYMIVSGPELDQLNNFIDEENRKILIHQRLLTCRFELEQVLQSKEKLSELIQKTLTIAPPDTTFWTKYIKHPNQVHSVFAQNVVMYTEYATAYEKVLLEYEGDEVATEIIKEQIAECQAKVNVYSNVLNLTLMDACWKVLTARLKENKKCNHAFLEKEAISAIDRIRRCKQNLPFPDYNPKEKRPEQIYASYMKSFTAMLSKFNSTIFEIRAKEIKSGENPAGSEVNIISIPGYFDPTVLQEFAMYLIIIMGRIVKALTVAPITKHSAIQLDAYFNLFCRLGTDIYAMNSVWNMMSDFVKYSIDTWPVQATKGRK